MDAASKERNAARGGAVRRGPVERVRVALGISRQEVTAILFILPMMTMLTAFLLIPTVAAFSLAFQDWAVGGVRPNQWVGFGNYARMVQEWRFWNSLRVTSIYAAGMVVFPYALALPLALFMNMKIKGRTLYRTLFFLPVVTPVSAAGLVFVFLFNTDFGIVNAALVSLGLIGTPISWLGRAGTAIPTTLTMIVWSIAGFNAITLLAGLQVITDDIVEAATLDGATRWPLFRYITLPMLKPASVVVVNFGLVGAFKVFGEIYVMTQGGPAKATEVLGLYLYENAFHYWQLGYATAVGTVIFAICLIVQAVMSRLGRVDWR